MSAVPVVTLGACSPRTLGLNSAEFARLDQLALDALDAPWRRAITEYFEGSTLEPSDELRAAWDEFEVYVNLQQTYPKCDVVPPTNPVHVVDPLRDTRAYIELWRPEYKRVVRELAAGVEPMTDDCLLSVAIPVAPTEFGNIYHALDCYRRQSFRNFEIVALLNQKSFGSLASASRDAMESTLGEVQRFRRDHPQVQLRTLRVDFGHTEVATVGMARSLALDVAAYRYCARGDGRQLFLESADADLRGLSSDHCGNWVEIGMRHGNRFDAFRGYMSHSPECLAVDPLLYASLRFCELKWRTANLTNPTLSGASFMVGVGSYACVGGIPANFKFREDTYFAEVLKCWRGYQNRFRPIFPESATIESFTSSRRAAVTMDHGHPVIKTWENPDCVFRELDEVVRSRGENGSRRKVGFTRDSFIRACELEFRANLGAMTKHFLESDLGGLFKWHCAHSLGVEISASNDLHISDPAKLLSHLTNRFAHFYRLANETPPELPSFLMAA